MEPRQKMPREEFDGPWKDIAEQQLSQLIAFFVPEAWKEIDWERKPVSLNTELRRSRRDAASTDRRDRWSELEESRNIFAVVVMAYLKTQDTRHDPRARLQWKLTPGPAPLRAALQPRGDRFAVPADRLDDANTA
jgi:hypothetical protein